MKKGEEKRDKRVKNGMKKEGKRRKWEEKRGKREKRG